MTSTAVRGRPRLRRLRWLVRAYEEHDLLTYGSVFGPLATAVVLMGYLYFSAVIFLGGVQADALVRVEAGD